MGDDWDLTCFGFIRDQDIKKMKQQEEQIEKLVSDWRKASELAEASEAEVEALKTRLQCAGSIRSHRSYC